MAEAAEMNALAAERGGEGGGGGGGAVDAWRKKVADALDGPADRSGGGAGSGGNYGALAQRSFPPPAPSDNLPVPQWDGEDEEQDAPNIQRSRVLSSEGDDEWAQVREDYGKKPPGGPLGWAKRMPSHVLVMLTVVLVVGAILCAIIFMHPGRSTHPAAAKKSSMQKLAKQEATQRRAAAGKKAAVPPLTGAQKKEVEKLASAQAQQMASAAMAAAQQAEVQKEQQQEAAQRQAAEEAKEQKRAALKQLLTAEPTDSPEVRVQIHRALRQQRTLAFDKQRVQVAQNNLAPLENNVNTKQAAFDAENQQYLSWERKMQEDENELQV